VDRDLARRHTRAGDDVEVALLREQLEHSGQVGVIGVQADEFAEVRRGTRVGTQAGTRPRMRPTGTAWTGIVSRHSPRLRRCNTSVASPRRSVTCSREMRIT
jgi:hypothetical protein